MKEEFQPSLLGWDSSFFVACNCYFELRAKSLELSWFEILPPFGRQNDGDDWAVTVTVGYDGHFSK